MSISSIKCNMLLPEREIIINKDLVLEGKPALIASLTEQEGIIKLWIFQVTPDSSFDDMGDDTGGEGFTECVTNQEEIWRRVSCARANCGHISEIIIQGVKLPIYSLSCRPFGRDFDTYMKLQHFIEAGVDFSSMEEIGFNGLIISEYQMTEETAFPEIDVSADIPVSLNIRKEYREELLEPTRWFELETGEHNRACSFYDPVDDKEILYYINSVVVHDIWKEMEERFNDEEALKSWREQGADDAAIEQARANLPESIGRVCPRGSGMLLLQYECTENIQLNFYTTEFLLSKPKKNESDVAVSMVYSSDEKGSHGYQLHSCLLKTVPLDFKGTVEVELISWLKNIPDERVEA